MNLTKEQRDNRDQLSAGAAIELAQKGEIAGIVVDDEFKMKRMLKRVIDIAVSKRLKFGTHRHDGWIELTFGEGGVRIFAADKLADEMKRP